jgi:hypothetical protein
VEGGRNGTTLAAAGWHEWVAEPYWTSESVRVKLVEGVQMSGI